jgi:uncharacterized lipoprotein YddW (UPF0748 family)
MKRRNLLKSALIASLSRRSAGASAQDVAGAIPATTRRKPRIMFYHDGRHPLIYMYEPPIQKEEYQAAVDELAGTPVEALMFCLGDGRTVLHDTRVGELWGHNVKQWSHLIFRRAYQNAKELIDKGYDPLRVICERAHAKGLLIYPTLLVQQTTGVRGQDVRSSEFRFNNRRLEIGASGGIGVTYPEAALTCLDFKHPEVREERFALIQEALTRYPVDGFELQLDYVPYYFRPDEVDEGRKIMTEWIARVGAALRASGADRELAVRVPTNLEACYRLGLDVREWIRQGMVDVIIGQTYASPELMDQSADFRPLVAAAKGSACRVHAAIQSYVDSDRIAEGTVEMVRAAACNYWAQGVHGLYLASWFGNWPYQASFYQKLRELPHPDIMATKDKFYFVPTTTGRYEKPALEPGLTMQLPIRLEIKQPARVEFTVADDLPRWRKAGRVHEVLLRFRILETTELDRWRFRFNGETLPNSRLRKINEMYKMSAPRYRVFGYWFVYRLDPEHWPKRGPNELEVTLQERDPDVVPPLVLRDVELEIKYLMGKTFRGEQEADLGPAESVEERTRVV